ncbi:Sideroflexin-2 [Balamuthia mandrillaris]
MDKRDMPQPQGQGEEKKRGRSVGPPPNLNLDAPRYDQSTFVGRLNHFWEVCDMRTLFYSKEKILAAQRLLRSYKEGGLFSSSSSSAANVTEEDLWEAKRISDAAVHPDTGQIIPAVFRMSFQVPYNMLAMGAMLSAVNYTGISLFLHFCNQTYNVCLNYANRNASNEMSYAQMGGSYAGALITSMGTAVGLPVLVKRMRIGAVAKQLCLRLTPFVAISAANLFNISLMRNNEVLKGIELKNEDGDNIGLSKKAGVSAISQTVTSRVFANIPGLVVPPIVMQRLESTRLFQSKPYLSAPVLISLVGLQYLWAYPVALGMYPQFAKVPVNQLESHFQGLTRKNGQPVLYAIYNKGL